MTAMSSADRRGCACRKVCSIYRGLEVLNGEGEAEVALVIFIVIVKTAAANAVLYKVLDHTDVKEVCESK